MSRSSLVRRANSSLFERSTRRDHMGRIHGVDTSEEPFPRIQPEFGMPLLFVRGHDTDSNGRTESA